MAIDHILYLALLQAGGIIGLIRFKRLGTAPKLLTVLLWVVLLFEGVNYFTAVYFNNNRPSSHLIVLAQIILYTAIYFSKLSTPRRQIILALGVLAFGGSLYYSVTNDFASFPSFSTSLLGLLVVIAALINFLYMLRNPVSTSILQQFDFWFNAGNLIFFGSTFFVLGLLDFSLSHGAIKAGFWGFNLLKVTNYLLHSCYIYALICAINQSRQSYGTN